MLTDEEFVDLVQRQNESRHLEFKPPGRRDDGYLFAQVTRAASGTANTRDGGRIILGVEEQDRRFVPAGLSAEQLATWRFDDVAARFAVYADPPFDFDSAVRHFAGMQFVVLEIAEFEQLPILCRIDYQVPPQSRRPAAERAATPILRAGACYVRSRRKPETAEIPTQTEMRDLLNLAIRRGVRQFLDDMSALGLINLPTIPTDQERHAQQRQGIERDV